MTNLKLETLTLESVTVPLNTVETVAVLHVHAIVRECASLVTSLPYYAYRDLMKELVGCTLGMAIAELRVFSLPYAIRRQICGTWLWALNAICRRVMLDADKAEADPDTACTEWAALFVEYSTGDF